MREGYGSRSVCVCVCVSVCYHTSCYIPGLYDANKVPLGFLWHLQGMNCVDFIENALFKSSGNGLLRFLTSSRSMKGTAMASFQDL